MEELTGILFVVIAIVLKVIEAKTKKAARQQEPKEEHYEVFPEVPQQSAEEELPAWVREMVQPEPVVPAPVEVKPAEDAPVQWTSTITYEEAMKPMKKAPLKSVKPAKPVSAKVKKPILQEEKKKTREKIDPKKLIVYSEIMNRKY